jgi:pyridoxine 4-dehydrogenase
VLGLYRSRCERQLLESALNLGIRAIDTSYNYQGFASHRMLAATAHDLLPEFSISTKVGFFPGTSKAEHSLAPARLREAMQRTAVELARAPDLVFLHNPEHSLLHAPQDEARAMLTAACHALAEAAAEGLCGSWGVASWNPRPLAALLRDGTTRPPLSPHALMTRAGLLVGPDILQAAGELADLLAVPAQARWGMSPFGGDTTDPIWRAVDASPFLTAGQEASRLQAAFRAAFFLPPVTRIAAGTNTPGHLSELAAAALLEVNENAVRRYRALLQARSAPRSPPPAGPGAEPAIRRPGSW